MSLEDDDVLNSTSKCLRVVSMLNALNESVNGLCQLELLHLDRFVDISLSLREPNPKYREDHAAVCKGIHDFALQAHDISRRFQFFSQLAFAYLLKSGMRHGTEEEATSSQKLSQDAAVPEAKEEPMCAGEASSSPTPSVIIVEDDSVIIVEDESGSVGQIPLPKEPFELSASSSPANSHLEAEHSDAFADNSCTDEASPASVSRPRSASPLSEPLTKKIVAEHLKKSKLRKTPYDGQATLSKIYNEEDVWTEFVQCQRCEAILNGDGEELRHASICKWEQDDHKDIFLDQQFRGPNAQYRPVFQKMVIKRPSNGLHTNALPAKRVNL